MDTAAPEPPPGYFRSTALEQRARLLASAAMAASRGFPPSAALRPLVTDEVFHRLCFRSRGHRVRRPDPGYLSRSFLQRINSHVIEATVIVLGPDRTRGIGIRLEKENREWIAVELLVI
ncbi:MAG: Rv3235 family protein [Bifidobacteriaceae bacterium]|jgi:hypothetical protein|nr:Rv3235 family protein [Bifidobacteriaceae bacterium]